MCKLALSIFTLIPFGTLDMGIGYFVGVPSPVAFVVVKVAACELMRSRKRLTIGAKLSLEGGKVESEKLISADELRLVFVKHVAVYSETAAVVSALTCFIYERMIKELKEIVAFAAVLNKVRETSEVQLQVCEG